jgi:DNA repair protein RadC
MENIKALPPMERPREKLQTQGAKALSDAELLAILLGSGTPQVPLHQICEHLLDDQQLSDVALMDMKSLCQYKGIGPAKATIILAATEFCRRVQCRTLPDEQACYALLKPLLTPQAQLHYILLLLSKGKELLAFAEVGSVLPDITGITELAIKAGAASILLARNGWPAFSKTESCYLRQLQTTCSTLQIICEGLMAVGPERFKMIT